MSAEQIAALFEGLAGLGMCVLGALVICGVLFPGLGHAFTERIRGRKP